MTRPILIIDDNPDDVDILCRCLRRAGVTEPAQAFPSGEEAISHLTEISASAANDGWRPLLFVIDVKMPGFRGAEVLQWICEHDTYASMAVVISSSDDPKDVAEAAWFGAQCYARKYPSPAEFLELIACAKRFEGRRDKPFEVACNLLLPREAS